ncbi:MAG TPA: cytochrome (ubi)quinol oxidase subunit III [Symbiobacteriaceae bacterium]|nr:cytochrome (ubi)quinol oxidase subunit III [Symbiobacteriaceae bacterium]
MSEIRHGAVATGEAAERLDPLKLGFWIFLASECLFFASLLGTYVALHGRSPSGPAPMDLFEIPLTTVSSFVLLMSSLTMVLAVVAAQQQDTPQMRRWLGATALLGLCFLGFQAYEFTTFVHEGLTLTSSVFGSAFFTLTGFHGAHVAVGVLWLLSLLGYTRRHGLTAQRAIKVELAGLYWHFVDVVWIAIFTVVYLAEAVQ